MNKRYFQGFPVPELTDEEIHRFWKHVEKSKPLLCWLWKGARRSTGYGRWTIKSDTVILFPHRVAYTLAKGPIEPGLTIDHLCFNKLCVNPLHLDMVPRGENARRGQCQRKRRTENKRMAAELTAGLLESLSEAAPMSLAVSRRSVAMHQLVDDLSKQGKNLAEDASRRMGQASSRENPSSPRRLA